MKIEEGVSRLSFFSSLYEEAKERLSGISETLEKHERQYRGDDRIDGSDERADRAGREYLLRRYGRPD